MAIILYKEGGTQNVRGVLCTAQKFEGYVDFDALEKKGWVRNPEMLYPKEPEGPTVETIMEDSPKDDTDLTSDEIRELAKEEGIKGYSTKKVKTLKKELGLD